MNLTPLHAPPQPSVAAAFDRPAVLPAAWGGGPVLRGPAPPRTRLAAPETLHPALWFGHQLGRSADAPLPSGFAVLDAQLPGGGWPRRAISELLLPHAGVGEIRLLAPVLTAVQRAGRLVMVFDPPQHLSAQALAQLGFDVPQLLVIRSRAPQAAVSSSPLWALEQALKSGHVGAVLGWLPPRLRSEQVRRLQLAAQAHDGPAFVLRESAAQQRPSAAPLRLALQPGGADELLLQVLKRRGPPLVQPLRLALQPVLPAAALRRREALRLGRAAAETVAASEAAALPAATFVDLA